MASRVVIAWILSLLALPAFAAEIGGFRVWTDPEKTRAVLDLDLLRHHRQGRLVRLVKGVLVEGAHPGSLGGGRRLGLDGDGLRRAHGLAKLAGDAALLAVRVTAQRVQATEAR